MKSMEITAVGIDVSKRKSTVAIRRPGGVIVACPFDISHSSHDLEKLVSILKTTGGDIRVVMEHTSNYWKPIATVYKGNIIKNLIMDCQSYTKYRPNETTGGIFVSWRRKEELPTGA